MDTVIANLNESDSDVRQIKKINNNFRTILEKLTSFNGSIPSSIINDIEDLKDRVTALEQGGTQVYSGSYSSTPSFSSQIYETKGKSMINDFTVNEIPTTTVSNPSDGYTITIG